MKAIIGGTFFVGQSVSSLLKAEEKDALPELQKAVEQDGYKTTKLPTLSQEGKGVFERNAHEPNGWNIVPYILHAKLIVPEDAHDTTVRMLLGTPANIGDQRHLGSKVTLYEEDALMPKSEFTSSIIYSRETQQNIQETNTAMNIKAQSIRGSVSARVEFWVLEPSYEKVEPQELEKIIMRMPEYPKVSRALLNASLIKEGSDRGRPYQDILQSRGKHGVIEGECGPKAFSFIQNCGVPCFYAEGYLTDDAALESTGGMHVRAMLRTKEGLIMVDPKNLTETALMPQSGFVTTKMSVRNDFSALWNYKEGEAMNAGRWGATTGSKGYQWENARLSSRTAGIFSQELENLKAPQSITDLGNYLIEQRKKGAYSK